MCERLNCSRNVRRKRRRVFAQCVPFLDEDQSLQHLVLFLKERDGCAALHLQLCTLHAYISYEMGVRVGVHGTRGIEYVNLTYTLTNLPVFIRSTYLPADPPTYLST